MCRWRQPWPAASGSAFVAKCFAKRPLESSRRRDSCMAPVIQGAIADRIGIHHAFFLPVLCYLYILFYAVNGSKPNSERFAKA
jgi:hypothetical protein